MNKINKLVLGSMMAVAAAVGFSSCASDFLDEHLTTNYSTQYFETEEGLDALAISLYGNLRYHFAYEWAYAYTQYGCDEFSTGTDLTSDPWNKYNASLAAYVTTVNANTPQASALWDQMYYGIASANTILTSENIFKNTATKNRCMGEAYFMRGYNYFRLVSQYGGVVLKTTPSQGVERNFDRSSAEDCLKQVIEDLRNAYNMLPETSARGTGGWVKATAGHFLAKALLSRCSEINDGWNTSYKTADLAEIITVCDYVMSARPLAADFRDLWNWTDIDCPTEKLPEFLLVAIFNGDASTAGRFKNRTYSYFNSQFSNYCGAWIQRGMFVGMDFQRCRPTEYNYSTYDKVNDSRFWKSFKTTYNANKIGSTKKPDGSAYNTQIGDLAIMFICNDKTDSRFDDGTFGKAGVSTYVNPATGLDVPNAFVQYQKGVWQHYADNIFAGLGKYEDGSRTGERVDGNRDGVLARTAETYLIKAEALVRQGKYQDAIGVVNLLRKRAEYKAGEDRTVYSDGTVAFEKNSLYSGSTTNVLNSIWYKAYSKTNTYYLSTGIPVTTVATNLQIASYTALPKEDEAILSALGVSGDYNRMLNFLMNERTRELNGEFVRWEDLSRTKLLVTRAKKYNKEVATVNAIDDHHLLRPIPQAFLDGLQNDDGTALTPEQKAALQNPGY